MGGGESRGDIVVVALSHGIIPSLSSGGPAETRCGYTPLPS